MQLTGATDFRRKLKKMPSVVRGAGASALNKTVSKARTQLVRVVSASKQVPQKQVKRRVFIARATARQLKVVQVGYAKPISLVTLIRKPVADTGRRRKRKLRVNKQTYDEAFIRQGKNSKVHVFARNGQRGRQGKGRWAGNKNLERLDKVSIPIQAEIEKHLPAIQLQVYRQDFRRVFAHEYNFRKNKLK